MNTRIPFSFDLPNALKPWVYPAKLTECSACLAPIRFIARIAIGLVTQTFAAPLGVLYHTGKAISYYKDRGIAKEHLEFALLDLIVAIWGIATAFFGIMTALQLSSFDYRKVAVISLPFILPLVYACYPPIASPLKDL